MWELDHKESWVSKNWCFWTVVLDKTLESPLDSKEIQPVHPKGDQFWIFIGRTDAEAPILCSPDAKNWLIRKDPDAGKDWRQKEKGTTEDEMVGWHHWLNGHGFGWTLGVGDGQGGLACCGSWGCKESDTPERLNWTELYWCWERLKAGGEGDDRGWDGWMASPTQWTWVWASFRIWWWIGKPGVLQSMGLQRVWATELNWTEGTWGKDFNLSFFFPNVFILTEGRMRWVLAPRIVRDWLSDVEQQGTKTLRTSKEASSGSQKESKSAQWCWLWGWEISKIILSVFRSSGLPRWCWW